MISPERKKRAAENQAFLTSRLRTPRGAVEFFISQAKRDKDLQRKMSQGSCAWIRYDGHIRAGEQALRKIIERTSPVEFNEFCLKNLKSTQTYLSRLSVIYGDIHEEFLSDHCRFSHEDYVVYGEAEAWKMIMGMIKRLIMEGAVF